MIKQIPYQQKVVTRHPIAATNVVKGSEVRVKDGLCEVRGIFQRVDNAFKKRKEENEVLALAVSDLENHLTYLENQTQDQITATTALNLSLSSTQKNLSDVSDVAQDVFANSLEELSERLAHLGAATEQAETSVETMRSNLDSLGVIKRDMEGETRALLAELEEHLSRAAEQERLVAELQIVTVQKEAALKDAQEKLADQKLQEQQLQHSIAESQRALPAVKSRCEGLRAKLEETRRAQVACAQSAEELKQQRVSLECAAEARRTAFATQSGLREEEITTLNSRYADACALRNARYQVLQDMQKQYSELESQLAQRRQSLRVLEEAQHVKAQQLQDAREEVQRLREKHSAAIADHNAAQDASIKAQQFNEQQYELTCLRMTQLRELQQQQCSLAQDLHGARWKLSVTVEELRGRVQSQKAAAAQAVAESQKQRLEAEKSAAELWRLREQRQDVVEALQREEALQRDLEAEAAALTATREEQNRTAERQAALNLALAAREDELRQLRESNAARTQANEAAAQELAAAKAAVAEAKAKLKCLKKGGAGPGAADSAQLPEDLAAQLQAEVDGEVQEMRAALDAQHAAEIAEINQCLEKLASGFPDPAAADSDMQAKEIEVVSARHDLELLKQQLAAKQRQEDEDDRRRAEEQRLLDEARRQKELADEATREGAGRDMDIEEHAAGLDEFFLFERVESESPHAHTVRERSVQVLTCGMNDAEEVSPVDVCAAIVDLGVASPTQVTVRLQRQLTPQLPAPSSGPSRWELSEPATRLPPFVTEPIPNEMDPAGRSGTSVLHADSADPPPRLPATSDTVASHSSQSQPESQRRGKKKKRRNRHGKSPPSSAASSLDLLKPQPALGHTFPAVLAAPAPARSHTPTPAPAGVTGELRGGFRPPADHVRTEQSRQHQSQRHQQPVQQLQQLQQRQRLDPTDRPPAQQAHGAREPAHASRTPSSGAPAARSEGAMAPPRVKPSASAAPRKSLAFPAIQTAAAQQQQRPKASRSSGGAARKAPSPGDWFAEDAPF